MMAFGFLVAALVCMVAVIGGIWLLANSRPPQSGARAPAQREDADFKFKEGGREFSMRLRLGAGVFLVVSGIAGMAFISVYYWRMLLLAIGVAALIILGLFGVATGGAASRPSKGHDRRRHR